MPCGHLGVQVGCWGIYQHNLIKSPSSLFPFSFWSDFSSFGFQTVNLIMSLSVLETGHLLLIWYSVYVHLCHYKKKNACTFLLWHPLLHPWWSKGHPVPLHLHVKCYNIFPRKLCLWLLLFFLFLPRKEQGKEICLLNKFLLVPPMFLPCHKEESHRE